MPPDSSNTRVVLALLLVCGLHDLVRAQAPARPGDAEVQRWLSGASAGYLRRYRQLHARPELSLHERETSALAARALRASGLQVTGGVGGYGVVGVLANGSGKTVLLRGDMDALPVTEETGLPYTSKVTATVDGRPSGVMHACGHDLHVVNLLATVEFLARHRALWSGTLVVIVQPAEELGEGAAAMLAAPAFARLPRADYAIALHVDPDVAAGSVGVVSGWAAANVDSIDLTLFGRGGHGARPQAAVDPIVTAAHLITALQTLVSRRNDPLDPAVVTVGSIHAGTKHNVIPDEARLQLTVRSYSDESRARLLDGVRQLARDVCTAFGCARPPDVKLKERYTPAVYNDPELAARALRVFGEVLGSASATVPKPSMGGEDFGRFPRTLAVPGLLFRLGAVPPDQLQASKQPGASPLPGLHSSRFAPQVELALPTGVRAMTALVLDLLPPVAAAPAGGKAAP